MHLAYDLEKAVSQGNKEYPQAVMASLGIKSIQFTPREFDEAWWFWGCTKIPDELPDYVTPHIVDPFDYVGLGLSHEDALRISKYGNEPFSPTKQLISELIVSAKAQELEQGDGCSRLLNEAADEITLLHETLKGLMNGGITIADVQAVLKRESLD